MDLVLSCLIVLVGFHNSSFVWLCVSLVTGYGGCLFDCCVCYFVFGVPV